MKLWVSYIGIGITLILLIWNASSEWTDLNSRIRELERHQTYEHGAYKLPGEK